jgi:hypothetical protein
MTSIKGSIKIERIPGDCQFVRLLDDFTFYSDVLNRSCTIPKGFIYDEESVPLIKGTNPEAGAIHDYLCRTDSDPVVSKSIAADVYQEFQDHFDQKESGNIFNRIWDKIRRFVKTSVVKLAPGYWHQYPVMATYEAMRA